MSILRNVHVTDPVVPTRRQTVNASGEALIKDSGSEAILTTIDTAVDLIATKQSDKIV